MQKQILYIMTGLPYAGKSTLRRELVKRFTFSYVSVDTIMDEKDMWRQGHPTREDWGTAYTTAFQQIEALLCDGKTVIFDCGNLPKKERENARKIAEKVGVPYKIIYVNTTKDEVLRRRKINEHTQERGHVSEQSLEGALRKFEEPGADEQPVIYNAEMNINEWIEKNIHKEEILAD